MRLTIGTWSIMPQIIRCPHCQKSMQIPDNVAGKRMACLSCKKPFMAPSAAPPPIPAVATLAGSGGSTAGGAAVAPRPSNGNGARVGAAAPTPTRCPQCNAQLLEGAVACMDCGYMLPGEGGPA